jgi:hypothetical protein
VVREKRFTRKAIDLKPLIMSSTISWKKSAAISGIINTKSYIV